MTATIESACTITKRELDHKPGATEIRIMITCDAADAQQLIINTIANLHKTGIIYVPENIYHEVTGC